VTWTVTSLDSVVSHAGWRPLRIELGVEAFGVNSWHGEAGETLVIDHDEVLTGHEELYVVLSGHARIEVNGEPVDAPAGTLVFVGDPGARRLAVALVDGTEIFTVGSEPGEPFRRSGWEIVYELAGYYESGDYGRALALAEKALVEHSTDWAVLYWAATSAAQLGRFDEALDYLRRAAELEPTIRPRAETQPAFDPIRAQVEDLLA
jgi:quercetin dioxygenase-like cupin family protein